jgi:hypothetical protein
MKNVWRRLPLVAVLSFTVTPALAVEFAMYPASMCERWSSAESPPELHNSEARNPSTAWSLGLDCPIIRPTLSTSYTLNGYITFTDSHPSARTPVCSLISWARNHGGTTTALSRPCVQVRRTGHLLDMTASVPSTAITRRSHVFFSVLLHPSFTSGLGSRVVNYESAFLAPVH